MATATPASRAARQARIRYQMHEDAHAQRVDLVRLTDAMLAEVARW